MLADLSRRKKTTSVPSLLRILKANLADKWLTNEQPIKRWSNDYRFITIYSNLLLSIPIFLVD